MKNLNFKKWLEAEAIVSSCKPTATYQVWGACSDLKRKNVKKKHRRSTKS